MQPSIGCSIKAQSGESSEHIAKWALFCPSCNTGEHWLCFHGEHLSKCLPALSSYHGICAGKAKAGKMKRCCLAKGCYIYIQVDAGLHCTENLFSPHTEYKARFCAVVNGSNCTAVDCFLMQRVFMSSKEFFMVWKQLQKEYERLCVCVCRCVSVCVSVCLWKRAWHCFSDIPAHSIKTLELLQMSVWGSLNTLMDTVDIWDSAGVWTRQSGHTLGGLVWNIMCFFQCDIWQ